MTAVAIREALRPLGLTEKVGLVGMLLLTLIAVSAQWLVPFDPQARVAQAYLAPSFAHWFGTDEIGRDLFSRVLLGIQYTWLPALALVIVCLAFGTLIGLMPSILTDKLDPIVKNVADFFLILPGTLVALAVIATLGPGLRNTMIAIGVAWWPWYARIARNELRRLRVRPHVEAARVAGVGRHRLTVRYILPGALPALLVAATLDVSNVIMTISLMSFLGLGQPAPAPELGAMTSRSLDSLTVFWWLPIMPALAIFLICFLSNLAGDGMRAVLRGA
ncbi:ABC transporter permease [Rhizobium sp. GCM10022189]|uniref:ABC transporter permease n=1 Tax=Rhizobium sp. GCM10022189 TaxID=3252654 RepID=UPI00361FC452